MFEAAQMHARAAIIARVKYVTIDRCGGSCGGVIAVVGYTRFTFDADAIAVMIRATSMDHGQRNGRHATHLAAPDGIAVP